MDIVNVSHTAHVNIAIPPGIKIFDDDKTLMLKAEDMGTILDWLQEAVDELGDYL